MTGAARWDERHAASGRRTEPADFVRRAARFFPPRARVLDVAGGTGRNAVWLAGRGFDVTLIDFSAVAVRIANESAADAGVSITTRVLDIAEAGLPAGPERGNWEAIVMHHFLDRSGLDAAPDLLAPGGVLAFCQPTVRNLERNPRPSRRWLLNEGELAKWAAARVSVLEMLEAGEGWFDGRYEARVVARRLATG